MFRKTSQVCLTALAVLMTSAASAQAVDVTFTGANKTNGDNWYVLTNWNSGAGPIPSGTDNVIIPAGKQVTAESAAIPTYTGNLTLGVNSLLQIAYTTNYAQDINALGTVGATTIYMNTGSTLNLRTSTPVSYSIPAIQLMGDATVKIGESTQGGSGRTFAGGITGDYTLSLQGTSGKTGYLTTANSFSALVADWSTYSGGTSGGPAFTIRADAAGSLGNGDVTIKANSSNVSVALLVVNAPSAMADTAALNLNGTTAVKLTMNANDTIAAISMDGMQQLAGTYGKVGSGANYEVSWINSTSTGILTVTPPRYWAAAGGATPNGTWSSADANWNDAADGSGAALGWTSNDFSAGQTAVFAAGTGGTGAYTVTVDGTQTFAGMIFEEGTVKLTGGTALQMIADSSVKVATGLTATIETPISQDGTNRQILKTGEGTLVLSGANTYAGATNVAGGTLRLGASNVLPDASAVTVSSNTPGAVATLDLNGNDDAIGSLTLGGAFITCGAAVTSGAGTLTLGGNVTYNATNNPLGATISGKLDLGGATRTFTVNDSATAAYDLTVSADISGSGVGLTKAGAGAMLLSGTNTFDGPTTVSAGILMAPSATALPGNSSAANVINGGTLAVRAGGTDWTTGQIDTLLAGATKTSGALGIDTTNGDLTQWTAFTTANFGGLGLAKFGNNKLTLDQPNTYTGATTVYAGTLTAANGSAFGASQILAFGADSTGTVQLNGNSFTFTSLNTNAAVGTPVVENGGADNVTLTVNNSAANTYAGVLRDGAGAGTLKLVKSGTGALTLSGANTYSGGTTITAGTVTISNATSFGSGDVLVTGSSRINAAALAYANNIDVGAALQLQNPQSAAPGGTATYSGQLTGSGAITIVNGGGNGILAGIAFTATNNTFTGNVIMPSGSVAGDDRFSFNSIGDGGNFTFRKRGHQSAFIYTGSSAITFNTRQIALAADFGGSPFDGMGATPVNRFMNDATDAAHTVTFNTSIAPAAVYSSGYLFFDGSNTGDNTFAGTIPDMSNYTLNIGKNGSGKWILSGENTYSGTTLIANGTLSVNAMDIATNAQPLGKGSLVTLGNLGTSGTLEFTGSANSTTDKQIQIGLIHTNSGHTGAGSILNNSTTGTLTFSNATFNPALAGVTATRTLTLGGSYTGGNNEIQGTIQNNNGTTGKVALAKSGASTWVLSGANTYSGITTVNGGTLQFAKQVSLYNNTPASWIKTNIIVNSGGTLGLNVGGAGEFTTGDVTTLLTNLTTTISNNGLRSGSAIAFDTTNADGGTFTIADNIANSTGTGGGAIGLSKRGANTLVLTGTNTYTGPTAVNAGTLLVNNSLGSGTGTGAVTVNATGTLGGTGTIAGPVTVADGGNLAPGASAGQITLGNGLDMSAAGAGANMTWQLATLTDSLTGVPGTDFDFVNLTGGDLLLGGQSKLTLDFNLLPEAQRPGFATPDAFWTSDHSWKIIDTTSNFLASNFVNYAGATFAAGTFTTAVGTGFDQGDIFLTYTAGSAVPNVTWNGSVDNKWSDGGNWTPSTTPNVAGATANFTGAGLGVIDLVSNWTVGKLLLDAGAGTGYKLGTSVGGQTLMMDGDTGTAEIKASTGVHKINALVQTVDTQLDVIATGAGTVLKTNGGIDNTAGVALNLKQESSASLTVYGVTNNGAMTVSGTVAAAAIGGAGTTEVKNNSSLSANSIVQNTLTIGAGGSVTINATPLVPEGPGAGANAVPEPSTWALIGIGLLGLLAFRRRR